MDKVAGDFLVATMAFLRDDYEGLNKYAGTLGTLLLLGGLGAVGYPVIKGILAQKESRSKMQGFDEAVRQLAPLIAGMRPNSRGALDLPPGYVTSA
jgi:hypothetical protein